MAEIERTGGVLRFFIVGAPKAATTWLGAALDTHAQVHMSPVKEPHFFARPERYDKKSSSITDDNVWEKLAHKNRIHTGWIQNRINYERLMSGPPGTLAAGEATVAYLHSIEAAEAIAESHRNARIIILIREPVSRTLSHLRMDLVEGHVTGREEILLQEELDLALQGCVQSTRYISRSLYAGAIERYFKYFGRDQVLIIRFDHVRNCPDRLLMEVADFLHIDRESFGIEGELKRNESIGLRWPRVNYWLNQSGAKDVIRRVVPAGIARQGKRLFYRRPLETELPENLQTQLKELFLADIRNVESLTGYDLTDWRM